MENSQFPVEKYKRRKMEQYNFENMNHIHVIRIPKSEISEIEFVQGKQPKETLKSFYRRQYIKPDILVNAGFFYTQRRQPVFNFTERQKSEHIGNSGIGITYSGEIEYGENDTGKFKNFIITPVVFIKDGEEQEIRITEDTDVSDRRTLFG